MNISAVIPAYNEAERIGATVRAARALAGVSEVIVADDGSGDATAAAAQEAGARVVRLPANRGKAAALMAGIAAASGEAILLLDADLGPTAAEAQRLIDPVCAGEAEGTVANFPVVPGRGGGHGWVVRLARWGIRRATGVAVSQPLSGQRCLTRAALEAALPLAHGFGVETAMTIDILRADFRLIEVPTAMDHRVTRNDWRGQWHRARQLCDVARALFLRGRRR